MMHLGTITKDDQDSNMLYNFPLQVGRWYNIHKVIKWC
jgi:hypothetical protein